MGSRPPAPIGFLIGFGNREEVRVHWASLSSTFIFLPLGERTLAAQTIDRGFWNHF